MWHLLVHVYIYHLLFLLTHPVWDVTLAQNPETLIEIISTHTSRVGCDITAWVVTVCLTPISTHTSRVGCDWRYMTITGQLSHFYSHIPCGMWPDNGIPNYGGTNFYSHIPCGMWQCNFNSQQLVRQFLLTHPVWDVTCSTTVFHRLFRISTHTSRVGCDCDVQVYSLYDEISTHTSRVGCDGVDYGVFNKNQFLLTHPVWDVTWGD